MTRVTPTLSWRKVYKLGPNKAPLIDGSGNPIVDDRAIISACGRFSVCRITVNGTDSFEAWRCPVSRGDIGKRLGVSYIGAGARAIAELAAGEPSPQAAMF